MTKANVAGGGLAWFAFVHQLFTRKPDLAMRAPRPARTVRPGCVVEQPVPGRPAVGRGLPAGRTGPGRAALPGPVALARATDLILARERLHSAVLTAVRDVDRRELFTLAEAGSTHGWLRTQPGGDSGQLLLARRLADRPLINSALADGTVSGRAASQLCAALDAVPDVAPEPAMIAVLTDGLRTLLSPHTMALALPDMPITSQAAALRAELAAVINEALAATGQPPDLRLEPALLLAQHLPPGGLGGALDLLLDALQPDRTAPHPTPSTTCSSPRCSTATGTCAATSTPRPAPSSPARSPAATPPVRPLSKPPAQTTRTADSTRPASAPSRPTRTPAPATSRYPPGNAASNALRQLLRDLTHSEPGAGRPPPVALTIHASLDAVEGRLGALPGTLDTPTGPVSVPTSTLRRLGCHSQLTAVLLDAHHHPIGASGTHRSATTKERNALRAQWGPQCAINGCARTQTVPHHVRPWWQTHQTALRDLIPICEHDHGDLHEAHRTLRLKDGRLIDQFGWAATSLGSADIR